MGEENSRHRIERGGLFEAARYQRGLRQRMGEAHELADPCRAQAPVTRRNGAGRACIQHVSLRLQMLLQCGNCLLTLHQYKIEHSAYRVKTCLGREEPSVWATFRPSTAVPSPPCLGTMSDVFTAGA
jgi:hypothetical protein